MNAVIDLEMGPHIAVCRERTLPLALLEPQPAVTQETDELLALGGPRAGRDQRGIQLLGHVKMIALEPTSRYSCVLGKGDQLVRGGVADQVRPQPSVRGPAWWVDPDRHPLLLASGCRPQCFHDVAEVAQIDPQHQARSITATPLEAGREPRRAKATRRAAPPLQGNRPSRVVQLQWLRRRASGLEAAPVGTYS